MADERNVEMEQEEQQIAEAPRAIHHQTKKGADLAIARKEISQASHKAVLAGRISLDEAKELGRDNGPDGPVGQSTKRASKQDRTPTETPCLCGCGELVARNFKMGHDQRMYRVAREHLTEGRELTEAQIEYLETSGKMQRVKDKLAADEAKRQEREAKKAQKQKK